MALQPSNATVTVDGNKFNAFSAHLGIDTAHDFTGMPAMGRSTYSITCSVNMHDTDTLPFDSLKSLYNLANIVNREKIVDMKVEFWTDDQQQDAICTYTFRGWISAFHTTAGGVSGGNHILTMTFTPELDTQQYMKIEMGN